MRFVIFKIQIQRPNEAYFVSFNNFSFFSENDENEGENLFWEDLDNSGSDGGGTSTNNFSLFTI